MAKAKKDTTKAQTAPAKAAAETPTKAPAKKAAAAAAPAAKAPAAKKGSKPAGLPASAPLIDTDLAAAAAAAMIANRNPLGAGGPASGGQAKESSAFRQLKESLAKPGAQSLGGILGTGPSQQKKNQGHSPDRQVGRNQTFGADVNRSGVPRRTGG